MHYRRAKNVGSIPSGTTFINMSYLYAYKYTLTNRFLLCQMMLMISRKSRLVVLPFCTLLLFFFFVILANTQCKHAALY